MPREMYYMIPFVSGGIFILLGLYMFIKPEHNVKKEKRDLPLEIAKAKKNGIIVLGLGSLMILVEVFSRIG